jgi:DNA-binding CsgD family transcriptional regulator/pimeloyl-ACP methyl ester carboxylesterase
MEAPAVQYARTLDGFDIAYAVGGDGPEVVVLPFHHNHVERRWLRSRWVPGLALHNHVLHYDSRGQGLSTRGLADVPTLDDYRRDLEAVIDSACFQRFVLVAYGGFAHVAMRFAVENPERVRALIVICTCESHSAWPQAAFVSLAEENWDLFLDLEVRANFSPEAKAAFIAFAKASVTQADYVKMVRCFAGSSVTDVLPRLQLPVLFLHSKNQHWLSPEEGARLAAKIPGARLVLLDGDLEPDDEQGVRAMQSFISELPPVVPGEGGPFPDRLSAREIEVLRLVARGKSNQEIADELVISRNTVQRHVSNLFDKTGVANRAQAVAYARDHRIA